MEEEKNIDPWILFNKALKRLHLPEKELEIFYHYYIKQKKLCDWNGPESISKLSRICKHIIEHLKKEIKKTS